VKKISICPRNVNGIRAVHGKGFLEWLNGQGPDILCIQETKAVEEQLPRELKEIEGYHAFFSYPEKKGVQRRWAVLEAGAEEREGRLRPPGRGWNAN
jgi:hypothetical protein